MAHILIIEPDKVLASTYKAALENDEDSVIICASAQSAIFAADTLKPDVIILELQLIQHSGIEFLYEFRSYPEWQNIPIIINTVVPPQEFSTSSGLLNDELGITEYYYKPKTSLSDMRGAINKTLQIAA
jgi:DNA-binding response OmpR family regulator